MQHTPFARGRTVIESVTQLSVKRFNLESHDPAFVVERQGRARFLLTGAVSEAPTTALGVETPSSAFDVQLATHSAPRHAVERLRRALPRDVAMQVIERLQGVELQLIEALVPAAKPPRVHVFSTDLAQRIVQLDENRIELQGSIGAASLLTISCDNRRSTISVEQGLTASATATLLAANVPHGYRGLADGPIVSVWKDADFFSMVA